MTARRVLLIDQPLAVKILRIILQFRVGDFVKCYVETVYNRYSRHEPAIELARERHAMRLTGWLLVLALASKRL